MYVQIYDISIYKGYPFVVEFLFGNFGGKCLKIELKPKGVWYHGFNMLFTKLRANSTITQWRELAEHFSKKGNQ
ncbi:MAG: hypothetical protein OSJ61_15005 [Lachnospiraceae bacterium]|jgi:hypothetical protein|nr:hypothetical protein [Lachnospiraceae bacterium]